MRCAVFASGGGSNFQVLLERKDAGDLHVEFAALVTNNSTAGAADKARSRGVPVVHLPPSRFTDEDAYAAELAGVLRSHGVEMIVCAGYLRLLPRETVRTYRNRIVNIHPALLPAFGGKGMYGERVHQAVLDYGAKVTGITVHFVDERYDEGPVILQETVRVDENDDARSLAARVLRLEHEHYWRAVEAVARGRVLVDGRKVITAGAVP